MPTIDEIRQAFNRAFFYSFTKQKLFLTFCVLAACGLLIVFAKAISVSAGDWIAMSLTFLPFFLCSGILLSTGILLIRLYHDEVKNKTSSLKEVFLKSWEVVIGASYFAIPIILGYLLLWMMLGMFFLLREIPAVGDFFAVILAFGPFLLNFGSLILCLLCVTILYTITPIIALRGLNKIQVSQIALSRFKGDIFSNVLLALIALLPLLFCVGILSLAAIMTGSISTSYDKEWQIALQWFFIMIPYVALLTPAVVFFFSMSAEAHVVLIKNRAANAEI